MFENNGYGFIQVIQKKIYQIRGQKVMLDFDLAELYEVETKRLKEAIRRNIARFPADFMFELTREEYQSLRSQFASLEIGRGKYSKFNPYAFTEQGVAMLSGVLNSPKAIEVNISIMRAFVLTRQYFSNYEELKKQIAKLERKMNRKFKDVYEALNFLLQKEEKEIKQKNRKQIGYR